MVVSGPPLELAAEVELEVDPEVEPEVVASVVETSPVDEVVGSTAPVVGSTAPVEVETAPVPVPALAPVVGTLLAVEPPVESPVPVDVVAPAPVEPVALAVPAPESPQARMRHERRSAAEVCGIATTIPRRPPRRGTMPRPRLKGRGRWRPVRGPRGGGSRGSDECCDPGAVAALDIHTGGGRTRGLLSSFVAAALEHATAAAERVVLRGRRREGDGGHT